MKTSIQIIFVAILVFFISKQYIENPHCWAFAKNNEHCTKPEAPFMLQQFFLHVDTTGLAVEIRLNGIPLVKDAEGSGFQETQPVNIWLKTGDNSLSVHLSAPETSKTEAPLEPTGTSAQVRLFRHRKGSAAPDPAEVLVNFSWSPDNNNPGVTSHEWQETVDIPQESLPKSILWSQAQSISSISEQDKQGMFKSLNALATALNQNRFEDAFLMMQSRYQDEASSNEKPLERVKSAVLELWTMMRSEPGLNMDLPKFDELRFEVIGQDNLVHIHWPDHEAPIMFSDNENEIGYGIVLYFASIDGKWIIAR